ncbi:hypothetical protein ACFFRR_006694 [Megaselia abdita]
MKFAVFFLTALVTFVSSSSPYADVPKDFYKTKVFSDFFKNDLTVEEFEELSPLFKTLQVPYEQIILEYEHFSDEELDISFLDDIMKEVETAYDLEEAEMDPEFDLTLPSLDDLLKSFNDTDPMMADVKLEIEETMLDARDTMDDMSVKSNEVIRLLRLKLTKRRILKVLYKLIRFSYFIFTRVSRTAYCMYSHIPDYAKAVIDGKNKAVDCFKEAKNSTVALVKEVKKSIGEVKQSAITTKKIVKRCIKRKTILGKLFFCLTNISNVANEVKQAGSNVENAIIISSENAPDILARFNQCEVGSFREMIFNLNVVFMTMVKCIVYPLIS